MRLYVFIIKLSSFLLAILSLISCISDKNIVKKDNTTPNIKKILEIPPIEKDFVPTKKNKFIALDIEPTKQYEYADKNSEKNIENYTNSLNNDIKNATITKNDNSNGKKNSITKDTAKNNNNNLSVEEEYKKYLQTIRAKYIDSNTTTTPEITENIQQTKNIKSNNNTNKMTIRQQITKNIDDKNLDMTNFETTKLKELPLTQITITEGKKLNISIKENGWILKKMEPHLLKFESRKNYKENTLFVFNASIPGETKLVFIKYNDNKKEFVRRPYLIKIQPNNLITIKSEKTKQQKENSSNSSINNANNNEKVDFRMDLANSLFKQKKYNEAKNRYLSILQENSDLPEIYYKLGYIEKAQDDSQKALEYFKKNIESEDNIYYYESLYEIIKILKDEKKYSQAIDTFFKYATTEDLERQDAEKLFMLLADVYFYKQDFLSAANEYRKFYENFPNSKYFDKAIFFLAYSLENLENNPDYKEAYRLYKTIKEKYPESKYYFPSIKKMLYLERHYLKIF